MNKKELLGKRIKELRKEQGYTQDFLAEKLEIETRQLSKLETGMHFPSFETTIKLLETFQITFEDLISFDHLRNDDELKEGLIKKITHLNSSKLKNVYKIVNAYLN